MAEDHFWRTRLISKADLRPSAWGASTWGSPANSNKIVGQQTEPCGQRRTLTANQKARERSYALCMMFPLLGLLCSRPRDGADFAKSYPEARNPAISAYLCSPKPRVSRAGRGSPAALLSRSQIHARRREKNLLLRVRPSSSFDCAELDSLDEIPLAHNEHHQHRQNHDD